LLKTNTDLFNHIDDTHRRSPRIDDGVRADNLNYQRYQLKRALQERFFPHSMFMEQKIGYEPQDAA